MKIEVYVLGTATCESCEITADRYGKNEQDVMRQLREYGWEFSPKTLCSYCVKEQREKEEMEYHRRRGTCPF
jgi:hypothetical protein